MKRIVSISLGTSKRNKAHVVEILGEDISIERIGTDGDTTKFTTLFQELDGAVDCLGVGGADLWVVVGKRRYRFHNVHKLIRGVRVTPVVDGSGLKHTLERETIHWLQTHQVIDFTKARVLLVSAVDRFGMAQALEDVGATVTYGDLLFGLGIPLPLYSYQAIKVVGRLLLPVLTHLPQYLLYPTGEKQEKRTPRFPKVFTDADIIAGDWHYIRRYAPDRLDGKVVITQTVRRDDLLWLKSAGASQLITTTPEMGGETFATNVMEGVLVALSGKKPDQLGEQGYLEMLKKLKWSPNVVSL